MSTKADQDLAGNGAIRDALNRRENGKLGQGLEARKICKDSSG
ncbi:hypothetical protein [Bradyrhizobium sp. MOS001]|nr:hypothetical protein [Bradyrhizobium sp. MOS001]